MAEPRVEKSIPQHQADLGERLKTLRKVAHLTQTQVADKLGIKKATVSAWETGRNMPDPFALRQLAKMYGVSVDALLWDDSLSPEAMRFAAQYDNLSGKTRTLFETMWMAFFERATSDEEVAEALPRLPEQKKPRVLQLENKTAPGSLER